MKKLIRAGQFLRLLDSNNNLSISNIAVILMMTKILVAPAVNSQDIGLAIAALLPYITKKMKGQQ